MTSADDKNRPAAALDYLRRHNHYFQFDNNERVVAAAVSDGANVDEIAVHLGNLRDLETLTFYRTDLSDHGLCHLASLVGLKELSIDGSGFTSAGLAHLGAMSQLEDLYIRNARDLDLAAFACIARVPSLRRLSLRGGRFCDADLTPLAALVNLEELSLTENDNINGTFSQHLTELPRLNHLNPGEHVTDLGLASIARLLNLVELYMAGPFTNVGLGHLIALQKLATLAIDSEHVTAEGIAVVAELPKLNRLDLDTPRLTDDGIAALLRCTALENMTFRRSTLSDGGLQHLRDNLPKCGVHDFERDQCKRDPIDEPDGARPHLDSNTPFETLLAEASDFDLVDGTFVKIGARYGHWVDAAQYSLEERVVMLVWHSGGIIGNGGFEYLFAGEFDGDPDFRMTAQAYREAGLDRCFELFQAAFDFFPGGVVPQATAERSRLFAAANKSAREAIDRQFWQEDRSRERKLAEFIRKNAARLGNLDATS